MTYNLRGITGVAPAHLEGWAIFGSEKVSTGKFTVETDGTIKTLDGITQDTFVLFRDLSEADSFVITIEPEGDDDTEPSGIVLLSGSLSGSTSALEFPVDFSDSSGTYILATPSNGADTDETSGVWFLQLPEPPTPGLDLPSLGDGWVYEGWAVYSDNALSSGRFTSPSGVDGFDGYSASEGYPPFPGEDFLQNPPSGAALFPIDLSDGTSKVVISVEPDIDGVDPTGNEPFAAKPLLGSVPLNALDHVNYNMHLDLASLPSGTATIVISAPLVTGLEEEHEEMEGVMVTLEERVTSLETENAVLESESMGLEEDVSALSNSVTTWQIVSVVALIIGLAFGYAVLRFHR